MQHKYFESGEIIIESGELAKNLFIIIEGNVNIF